MVQQLLQFYDPPTPTNHLFWFNERLKILNSQCSLVSDSPLYYSTEEFKSEKDLDWNASRPHFSYTVYAEKKNLPHRKTRKSRSIISGVPPILINEGMHEGNKKTGNSINSTDGNPELVLFSNSRSPDETLSKTCSPTSRNQWRTIDVGIFHHQLLKLTVRRLLQLTKTHEWSSTSGKRQKRPRLSLLRLRRAQSTNQCKSFFSKQSSYVPLTRQPF